MVDWGWAYQGDGISGGAVLWEGGYAYICIESYEGSEQYL